MKRAGASVRLETVSSLETLRRLGEGVGMAGMAGAGVGIKMGDSWDSWC